MTFSLFRRSGTVCAILFGSASLLNLPPASAAAPATASRETAPAVTPGVVDERVSPQTDKTSEFGYYNTCPESPDGTKIAYVVYDGKPGIKGGTPGGLYLCDADLTHHVKIRDIAKISWHDGANVMWVDNDTIAYTDRPPGKGTLTFLVRRNGDLVCDPVQARVGQGEAPNGTIVLWVDSKIYPKGSSLGPNGFYLYKDGVVKKAVDLEKDLGVLRDRIGGSDNTHDWMIAHPQLSTNGSHISIRLDPGKGLETLVTVKIDGTDARLFEIAKKPLHQQWYDDTTLFGHHRGGPDNLKALRWDRDGKYIETLAGPGNHLGISPDRRHLVSENIYQSDPVVMKLYRTGHTEPLAVLMSVPQGSTWTSSTHVNPAFSRDGKKVYFNKPVDGMPQVYRIDLSHLIRRQD